MTKEKVVLIKEREKTKTKVTAKGYSAPKKPNGKRSDLNEHLNIEEFRELPKENKEVGFRTSGRNGEGDSGTGTRGNK